MTGTGVKAYLLRMNVAEKIVEKFGGLRPLARWLGHVNPSTVQGWVKRGSIPLAQIPYVMDAALRARVKVKLHEFHGKLPTRKRPR